MWVHLQRLVAPGDEPAAGARVGHARGARRCCRSRCRWRARRPPIWRRRPARSRSTGSISACTRSPTRRRRARCGSPPAASRCCCSLLPWVSRAARAPRPAAAVVDLANCNGCARCFADCPYAAVTMRPRTDGKPPAARRPSSIRTCAPAAASAPAPARRRRRSARWPTLVDRHRHAAGADRRAARRSWRRRSRGSRARPRARRAGDRRLRLPRASDGGADLARIADERTATIALLCAAQLPPSFVEYALRAGADGVLVTGCRDGDCAYRLGNRWTRGTARRAARAAPARRRAARSRAHRLDRSRRRRTARRARRFRARSRGRAHAARGVRAAAQARGDRRDAALPTRRRTGARSRPR